MQLPDGLGQVKQVEFSDPYVFVSPKSSAGSSELSGGEIAGIVVGSVVGGATAVGVAVALKLRQGSQVARREGVAL